MAFPQHPKKGDQTYCPEGGIKAGAQDKLSIYKTKNIWGDGKLLRGWFPFNPLDASKQRLEGPVVG